MSYAHLAGRLIETQRSLLGQRAVDIARSVEGLSVTDDGTVTEVRGDGRDVVGALVEAYVAVLGQPARSRLRAAAGEFEDELVLPASLGGQRLATAGGDSERVVEYSTPANGTLTGKVDTADDLSSVYVVAEDEHGSEWRLTVEDAVLSAVTRVTDLSVGDVDALGTYVDSGTVEAGPDIGRDGSFSFDVEGYQVTLQPDGNVHIR